MSKIRWSFVWGVFVTFTFLTLLAIHLEFFRKNSEPPLFVPTATAPRPAETWMNIYQNNKKIGVVHRTFTSRDKGFHFTENVFMQINTLGVVQPINIATQGDLNPDMTVSSFNFDLTSSLFRFNAHGYITKNKLLLFFGLPDNQQKSEIPLKVIPHMSGSIYDAAFRTNLEKDMTRNFHIFDPSTLAMRSIKVTRQADEIIAVEGRRIMTQKYCADFMGANTCTWMGKNGDVLKETGILGLSLEKVSPEKAREGIAKDGSIDLTQIASIPANVQIDKAEKLRRLKIKVSGIGGLFPQLNGDRQSFRKDVLTINREQIASSIPQSAVHDFPPDVSSFLKATPLVQANHLQMKEQVDKIITPGDFPEQKVRKIVNWVYRHVEKKPVVSVPNALEVLKNRVGDCNEHAVLTAALLRTAGIPAQIETGLVYMRGRFYYHAWNIAYCGNWITADAVFNQFPTDVTHIRLIRGEGSEQLDLMGVMGKIKLEILEQTQ
jgi:hypothetical protein